VVNANQNVHAPIMQWMKTINAKSSDGVSLNRRYIHQKGTPGK
jgi:hypothetical protein